MQDITLTGAAPDIKTACALGLFDGVHKGHCAVIRTAVRLKEYGLKPAVFTFRTDTVTSKGHDGRLEMILTDEGKHRRFEELGVEYLYSPPFEELKDMSPEEFVRDILKGRLGCRAAVCGSDFRFGKNADGNAESLRLLGKKYGIDVTVLDKLFYGGEEISSTAVRAYIRAGKIEKANEMLGYSFGFTLPVEHGNELGRTWSFPTINQIIPKGQILPGFGVYCSRVITDSHIYYGVTNVGIKPTVSEKAIPLAETYIIGFNGDLYGKTVEIRLDSFVRPEKKFGSLEELKAEIERNTEFTEKYYGLI
ncbi:MAG: riboflavin biosynthesis protein RibF [Ruminococcus sp.]|nr:riboflavin biosynthesis protein RibF [Ruminococcus sp.]